MHSTTFTHTYTTNTCITGDGLAEYKRNNNQYAEETVWVFSFDLVKRNAQNTGGRVPEDMSDVLKGSENA